jgi:exosortase
MAFAVGRPKQARASATTITGTSIAWFGALLLACYGPVLWSLARQWGEDQDMGHGFLVPVIAAWIAWRKREELRHIRPKPTWWGIAFVMLGAFQLYLATLGAELFLARTAFVISVIGIVLLLGGLDYVRVLAFPIFLLFFMVPIPAILYNRITFPLQILASQAAAATLSILQIPVLRDGNILELSDRQLSVVEACSGIRSLLSLCFLCLVYGYFFEKRTSVRVVLFLAAAPIAILANAARVALTGVLFSVKPEYAEGFFHTASGWVIFMMSLAMLLALHQVLRKAYSVYYGRLKYAFSR